MLKKRGLLLKFLSVAPQPMQITFSRAHDDHVMCVDIDTHIILLRSPAKQENKFKSNINGLQACHVSVKIA